MRNNRDGFLFISLRKDAKSILFCELPEKKYDCVHNLEKTCVNMNRRVRRLPVGDTSPATVMGYVT